MASSQPVDQSSGLRSNQIVKLTLPKGREDFPALLSKVRFFDDEASDDLIFLTSKLSSPALTVARLYRLRWRNECSSAGSRDTCVSNTILYHPQRSEDENLDCS